MQAGASGRILALSEPSEVGVPANQLTDLAVAPDVAPWVAGRIGLGGGFEGGLGATGRSIRLDVRKAFERPTTALSVGLCGSALMAARPNSNDASGVYGGGFEVPIVVGWRSSADIYSVWLGARVGAEIFSGQLDSAMTPSAVVPVSGYHVHGGGTFGFRVGFRHVYGLFELTAGYHFAGADIGDRSLTLGAVGVTPAGAFVVSF